MKLIVDSEVVHLPDADVKTFQEYCNVVMGWLLERSKSISTCKIDGQVVNELCEADALFSSATSFEVETVPLVVALQSAMAIHAAQLRRLEDKCEVLVTDCLLANPVDIANQWSDICNLLKEQLNFLPRLGYLLTAEQVNLLIDKHYAELNSIMMAVSEALPKADVVVFSDILEIRLLPWLKNMREFSQTVLKLIETMNPATS